MTDRHETRATTHADDCWSWGPGHYDCAVREIERLRGALEECHALSVARWQRLLAAEAENKRLRKELAAAAEQPESHAITSPAPTEAEVEAMNEAAKLSGLLDGIAAGCKAPDYRPVITAAELRKWAEIIRSSLRVARAALGCEG